VLGLERVGRHDNFFELGGHSLLVMQLISRIRDAFQVELPVTTVFESQSIATLAHAISKAEKANVMSRPMVNRLVALGSQESGPSMICVPGAGGQPSQFRGLAYALGTNAAVCSLQPVGCLSATSGTRGHHGVRDLAREYLATVRAQRDGPLYLVGHSVGALIAYEMASLLPHRELRGLLLIEPSSPIQNILNQAGHDYAACAYIAMSNLAASLGVSPDLDIVTMSKDTPEQINQSISDCLSASGVPLSAAQAANLVGQVRLLGGLGFNPPGRLDAEGVHIVVAGGMPEGEPGKVLTSIPNKHQPWSNYFVNPPTFVQVAGNHFSVLKECNITAAMRVVGTSFPATVPSQAGPER
jgi:thioesterase domain-containing protein/acyl carrier protein